MYVRNFVLAVVDDVQSRMNVADDKRNVVEAAEQTDNVNDIVKNI